MNLKILSAGINIRKIRVNSEMFYHDLTLTIYDFLGHFSGFS